MKLDLDILVVGGGPAGSACATTLAKSGAKVAIVESSNFQDFRIGETLHGSIHPFLRKLKFSTDDQPCLLPSPGVSSAWGHSTISSLPSILNLHGQSWRVDRRVFDKRLCDCAVEAGTVLFTNSKVESVKRESAYWRFSIRRKEEHLMGRARFVVEATGRNSKSKFAKHSDKMWVDQLVGLAFQSSPKPSRLISDLSTLVESTSQGWWYSVPLPSGNLLAVFFTDGDLVPRRRTEVEHFLRQQLVQGTNTTSRLNLNESVIRLWKSFYARSGIRRIPLTDGWVAIGDALLAFDPLYGQGVSQAIRSGISVAEWLSSGSSHHDGDVPSWVHQTALWFNEFLEARQRIYRREERWVTSPFWMRRQLLN